MQKTSKLPTNRKALFAGVGATILVLLALAFYLPGVLNRNVQSAGSSQLKIGRAFPDFQMKDLAGVPVTPASLAGKPYVLWFTTSWCTPCQIGAQRVAAFDKQLGGDKFNVVVVFVDPKETPRDLRTWQQKFATGDWLLGFDNTAQSLSKLVALQYLDSKYLVDANGILRDADFQMATNKYLKRISGVIGGSGNG